MRSHLRERQNEKRNPREAERTLIFVGARETGWEIQP
jgi:hypothetical protein